MSKESHGDSSIPPPLRCGRYNNHLWKEMGGVGEIKQQHPVLESCMLSTELQNFPSSGCFPTKPLVKLVRAKWWEEWILSQWQTLFLRKNTCPDRDQPSDLFTIPKVTVGLRNLNNIQVKHYNVPFWAQSQKCNQTYCHANEILITALVSLTLKPQEGYKSKGPLFQPYEIYKYLTVTQLLIG